MHIPGDHAHARVVRHVLFAAQLTVKPQRTSCMCSLSASHGAMVRPHGCIKSAWRLSKRSECDPDRYPTTVATLSRRARDTIEAGFERSVDEVWQHP